MEACCFCLGVCARYHAKEIYLWSCWLLADLCDTAGTKVHRQSIRRQPPSNASDTGGACATEEYYSRRLERLKSWHLRH